MKRVIVTGANGAGKSHFAAQLSAIRPDVPVVSLDALKLKTNWQRHPRADVEAALAVELAEDTWILDGGPSLLHLALPRADALVWLDPPLSLRAWQLFVRPLKHFGRTRAELPEGNVDWPLQQYRFAWHSLRSQAQFDRSVGDVYNAVSCDRWHCRRPKEMNAVLDAWANPTA